MTRSRQSRLEIYYITYVTHKYNYKYVPLTKENSLLVGNDDGGDDRLDLGDETSKLDLVSGEYFSRLAGFPW